MKRMLKRSPSGWKQLDYPLDTREDHERLLKCMRNRKKYERRHGQKNRLTQVLINICLKELAK